MKAYQQLKQALTSPPILLTFDTTKDIVLITDAPTGAIGAILELHAEGKCAGVVASLSRMLQVRY